MKKVLSLLTLVPILAMPAIADDEPSKPACLRVKSINGWSSGNEQIVRLETAGKRWRITFKEPCLGKEKPIGFQFGLRVGSYCVEPGDELIFVTIGGHEQHCYVAKVEQMKLGEKLIPDDGPAASQQSPPAQ